MLMPWINTEFVEIITILGAALLLGAVSGLIAVYLLTTRSGRLSLRAVMGLVVLATPLCGLIRARPSSWQPTVELWALTAVVVGLLDLAASCLVEPWRATPRFSDRSLRRLRAWLVPAIVAAVVGTLAVLRLRFDIPLNPKLQASFAAELTLVLLVLTGLDRAVRMAMIGLGRWRRMWAVTNLPKA